jgi:pyruvate dehydrogenase E2 component (dihydrolipoamide acetyltransferase)
MNVAASSMNRFAASPYARRLARDRMVDLADLTGSGPDGRIVAADVPAHPATTALPSHGMPDAAPSPRQLRSFSPTLTRSQLSSSAPAVMSFSATVSLEELNQLIADAARAGLEISIEDAALRAARVALAGMSGGIAMETEGRQILVSGTAGLSIGAERRLRLAAVARGEDAAQDPSLACLLVLEAARAMPLAMPPLPGRTLRLVLAVDGRAQLGRALLCAYSATITPARAAAALEVFAEALEEPLALLA